MDDHQECCAQRGIPAIWHCTIFYISKHKIFTSLPIAHVSVPAAYWFQISVIPLGAVELLD